VITASIVALGLLAAAGVFLLGAGLGVFGGATRRVPVPRLFGGVSLADEAARVRGAGGGMPAADRGSLIDRAITPLARSLLDRAGRDEREWLERALDLLNYPGYLKTVADYYASKVLFAAVGFTTGVVLGGALAAAGAGMFGLLALPLGLSALGYALPKFDLQGRLKNRREQMLFEVPYLLDRLNVNVTAERSLAQGLITMVSTPQGGYLMREFRQVVEDYLKNARLVDALRRMAARNAGVPLIERIAERLSLSEETGADTVMAMQVIGTRAYEMVENLVQERGEQNNTLMIVPTLIALVGILVAIAGPSLLSLMQFFKTQ
jgi:hypothetical protein